MVASNIMLEQCDGTTIEISTPLEAKVYELKRRIAEMKNLEESNLLILFCGDVLENSSTLASNNVSPDAPLSLEICTPKRLSVSLPDSRNIMILVDPHATKQDVIRAITEKYPGFSGKLRFAINNGEWEDTMRVGKIPGDDEVRLIAQEIGGSR